MKRIILISLCCLLIVSAAACGKQEENFNSAEFNWRTDYPMMNAVTGRMLETDTGYYLYQMAGGKIFYSDKEEIAWVPLCGRPECSHTSGDCNAWIGNIPNGISIYKDYIYYWKEKDNGEIGTEIWRLKLDGSGHEKYKELPEFNFVQLHRGYFYGIAQQKTGQQVWKIPVEGSDTEGEMVLEAAEIMMTLCWRDSVVFYGGDSGKAFFYRHSPASEADPYIWVDDIPGLVTLSLRRVTSEGMYILKTDGVYEYCFSDQSEKKVADLNLDEIWDGKGELNLICDDDFIYITETEFESNALTDKKIDIYDYDGNFIAEMERPGRAASVFFYNSTEECVFLSGDTDSYPCYCITKDSLRSGNPEVISLEKPQGRE